MIGLIMIVIALCATIWMYGHPSPLHEFLHPAHASTGNMVAQVIFALAVGVVCYLIDRKFSRRKRIR